MSSLWQDVRFSFRTLGRSPGFTLVAVLTMALGICALSSIFSVVNAVYLRGLPYEDPDRLVLVKGLNLKDETQNIPFSYLDFTALRQRLTTFESFAARTETLNFALRTSEGPEMVRVEIVSAPYFILLGVKPALGRTFVAEEDRAGGPRVALLSDGLWRSLYGADPSILGRTIVLDDLNYTVAGVLPAGFQGLTDEAQVWLPLSTASVLGKPEDYLESLRWLLAVGRVREDASPDQVRRDLETVMQQREMDDPVRNKDLRATATPLADAWFGELKSKLLILLAGGMLLLLIVCTNLANLLMARFVARRRDLSLRMALGAGRRGLVRQILTESVLLALLGCAMGLLVARWTAGLLVRASGIALKSFVEVNVDLVVVGVILLVSLAAGLLFGLVPALVLSTRLRLYEIFNDGGRRSSSQGDSHHRFQNMLIVAEVALALVLLVCAGLMTKGLQRLHGTQLGFDGGHVVTARMNTRVGQLKEDSAVWNLVSEMQAEIGAIPGVRSVALEGPMIPTDDWLGAFFTLEDRPESEAAVLGVLHRISPGYFDTLGVQVVRGRDIQASDTDRALPVAVINDSMAKDLWPGQSPLGKRILLGRRTPTNPNKWATVVGVAPDMVHGGLLRDDERPKHDVYLALLQQVPRKPSMLGLLVRTEGDAASLMPEVLSRLAKIAPNLPVYDPMTLEERLAAQTRQNRSFVLLMSLFAFFALALAAVGVYGVVSYSVANRTQEIGVRMALGAQLRDVLRLVVGQGSRLALVGVALGLLLAALVTPVLQTWLFGVSPLDKIILVGMSLLLLGVAVAASYIPARRAAKVAPFQALRLE